MAEPEVPEGANGRVERYIADEVVVGLAHEQLVLKQLLDLRIDMSEHDDAKERSPELGLTKLRFTPEQVNRGVNSLELLDWNQFGSPYTQDVKRMADERGGMGNVNAIDKLMLGLRKLFADDNDHWMPDMGKNRYVERVVGKPWVSGGAEGDPRPADPPKGSFAPRALDPGQGVRVGILDTVIESHPWLTGAYIAQPEAVQPPAPQAALLNLKDMVTARPKRSCWSGHGTFVTGLILQSAPGGVVELRKVLNDKGDGDTWKVATELVKLADSGVDLINVSLGTFTDDGQAPLVLARAVERLSSRVLLVAAAGNHGNVEAKPDGYPGPWPKPNSALWPAAFTEVIAVGATNADGTVAPFTPQVRWIDAYLRGVDLLSTFVNARVQRSGGTAEFKGFARWSGTSFAAAVLSGLIAAKVRPGSGSAREAAMGELAAGRRDDQGRLLIEAPFRG